MNLAKTLEDAREDWFGTAKKAVGSVIASKAFGGLSEEKRDEVRAELQTLLDLVTEVHEPRVAVVGPSDRDIVPLLSEILAADLPGDASIKAEIGSGRWYEWETTAGSLHLLDARNDSTFRAFRWGLPDVVIQEVSIRLGDDAFNETLARFVAADEALDVYGGIAPLVAAILPPTRGADDILAMRMRERLTDEAERINLPLHVVVARSRGELAEAIAPLLPQGARFPWARLTPATVAQHKVADRIIGIASSINATVASVPLPFASSLPITTVQILMIAAIAWVSGRERSLKTVAEFLTAAGLNVGAGYALRELARVMIAFVPMAGSVISAGIAASATLAVGEAAKRYFLGK